MFIYLVFQGIFAYYCRLFFQTVVAFSKTSRIDSEHKSTLILKSKT
jgi:hypothetical protein